MRLDQLLVARGLVPTLARARDAIVRGAVRLAGKTAAKPGQDVAEDVDLTLSDPAADWVSRAALKLVAGLDGFDLDVAGRRCLDVGASTGGFTEVLLKRDDLPEPARRQLSLIDRAGASLLTVVNDILDFSKMEAGEVELLRAPAAPRRIAQDALAIVAEAARRKGLDLQLGFIGPVEAPLLVDDLRVRQILLNLLTNAVKFTFINHSI